MTCLQCGSNTENPKFCNRSCAATYNNLSGKANRRKPEGKCVLCQKETLTSRTYCVDCWALHKNKAKSEHKLELWLNGTLSGGSDRKLLTVVREYVLRSSNYACCKCGFNTPHPDDGNTVLEINHINGDGTDHRKENLEALCPNCHALTSSYRGRNRGKGRPVFYTRTTKMPL